MNKNSIRWETFPRDTLSDVLFASPRGSRSYPISADLFQAARDTVQAGFVDERMGTSDPPRIFLLNDASAAETFSWLKVYAPEVWPLSQFGRVVSIDDWDRWSRDNARSSQGPRLDRWASVIVGEALAQGEVDVQVASLPLARAFACYSTPIALSLAVHGTDDASRICADRLRQIESDRRFARRLVEVNDLVGIWGLLGMESEPFSPRDAVAVVLEAAQRFAEDKHSGGYVPERRWLLQLAEFDSDSIEERVRAFHVLSNRLLTESERINRSSMPPALLAAAAFLVGRGTSHEFLLHQVGKAFPAAPVWFGLIAALAGIDAWDADWTRATKSVERHLRAAFDWTDAAGFDICWAEFSWLIGTFEGTEVFSGLPKLAQRAITVELIPGAACQFKLAAGPGADPDLRHLEVVTVRERELQKALSQFIGLAAQTRQLIKEPQGQNQQGLGSDNQPSTPLRGSRLKKNRPPNRF